MHACVVINASVNANYWNISSVVLWCVASTRTRLRSLITTTPSRLNRTCRWLHDRWATDLLGPPVIDAKAGAVSQWSCVPPSPMSMVAGRTRRSFRSLHALPPVRGGHAVVQSVSDGTSSRQISPHFLEASCPLPPSLSHRPWRRLTVSALHLTLLSKHLFG